MAGICPIATFRPVSKYSRTPCTLRFRTGSRLALRQIPAIGDQVHNVFWIMDFGLQIADLKQKMQT